MLAQRKRGSLAGATGHCALVPRPAFTHGVQRLISSTSCTDIALAVSSIGDYPVVLLPRGAARTWAPPCPTLLGD
eukprot:9490549-Pyramimonas_sp.AAC.1